MSLAENMTPIFQPAIIEAVPPSSVISIRKLYKRFGNQKVLRGVDLDIREGEMLVVLGPSGSGKTTLLRIIAGLEHPDAGNILLHGTPGTDLSPQERQLGVVFQEQALFQKMTAAQNIAFGLKVRKIKKQLIRRTVDDLLELTKLTEHRNKYPGELSGGQRQRVALSRALAYNPKAMLFDEPFSALDPLTRVDLRREVRDLLKRLKVAALFITHDQQEALELGDRIAILRDGIIEQAGKAEHIYNNPHNEFIASFMGTANTLLGVFRDHSVHIGPIRLPLNSFTNHKEGQPVKVVFRPEDVVLGLQPVLTDTPYHLGQGLVERITSFGSTEQLLIRVLLHYTPQSHRANLGLVSDNQVDNALLTVTRTKWEATANKLSLHDPVIVGLRDFKLLSDHPCSCRH
jgi:sulfate transport system ATP-binding protein